MTRRLACVGDSNTYGYGSSPGHDYPTLLQAELGPRFDVLNAGISGERMATYASTTALGADVVVIMLGTNDTIAWQGQPAFVSRCVDFVLSFRAAGAERVYVALPPAMLDWVSPQHADVLEHEVLPAVRTCAERTGAGLIDVHAALGTAYLIGDGVHINDAGAQVIAETVADAVEAPRWGCMSTRAEIGTALPLLAALAVIVLRRSPIAAAEAA